MRPAAIDIGSNAARLLISEVVRSGTAAPEFNKLNLIRIPLRLGFDVFEFRKIMPAKEEMIIQTMQAYKHLLKVYEVVQYKACATSAMRDAVNAADILQRIEKETGMLVKVISGEEEASVIYENHVAENMSKDRAYLYIDVGGGSTELTLFNDNQMVFKESFDIGTIRLLKNQVTEPHWLVMRDFIRNNTKSFKNLVAIGTGGNINKIFSMSKKKDGKPLSLVSLKNYHKVLSNVSLAQRMKLYSLREDRADVVVPALLIFVNVMRWAGTDEIFVPKIGLADGLIQHLYIEMKINDIEV